MLELKIKAGRRSIPIFDLPAALGRKQAYREIGDQVDALIAFLDDLAGDPDLEEDDPSGQCDEDGINTGSAPALGAGCPISDPGGGNVEDEEQMWFVIANSAPTGLPACRKAANDS